MLLFYPITLNQSKPVVNSSYALFENNINVIHYYSIPKLIAYR